MKDTNWEMLQGPVAEQIELLNYTNQINVLEGLIHFLLAHRGPMGNGNPPMPDETQLCALHYAGTLFLLADPGQYRNMPVHVAQGDVVVHQPPDWQYVKGFMQYFFRHLSSIWSSSDALDVAAYALWMVNWVHPFRNGNGRTARAFAYACLSLKIGALLPGRLTVIDEIMLDRARYEAALRAADESLKNTKIPDLRMMREFLDDLLQKQINSAVEDILTAQAVNEANAAVPEPEQAPAPEPAQAPEQLNPVAAPVDPKPKDEA